MEQEHISADRVWQLIMDGFQLEQEEAEHVSRCDGCNSFLATFIQLADAAGFSVQTKVPKGKGDDEEKSA